METQKQKNKKSKVKVPKYILFCVFHSAPLDTNTPPPPCPIVPWLAALNARKREVYAVTTAPPGKGARRSRRLTRVEVS